MATAKKKPEQMPIANKVYRDPITGRDVCLPCFNGFHDKCEPWKCKCMHLDEVKRIPKPKKDKNAQPSFDAGTINV